MRRALLTQTFGIALPAIGDAFMGGFFAGIIDTTQPGSILAADANQVGQRYALIVSDVAIGISSIKYKTTADAAPAACSTMWDGLGATRAMVAAGSAYSAAQWVAVQSYPTDAASEWYIGAVWEMVALYWLFKPTTNSNYTTAETGNSFPGSAVTQGLDPAMDPAKSAFTSSIPAQTSLAAFQSGGAQAFAATDYQAATEYDASSNWRLAFSGSSSGRLAVITKTNTAVVRPVRRLVL